MLTEALLLEQNRRLREENEELRETVRQLRERLPEPLPADVPYLSAKEEAVFRALFDRRVTVSRDVIYADLYGVDCEVLPHIVDVFISHLRRKLRGTRYVIGTVHARGWRLVTASAEAIAA
jgi:DNA-binding response OmpR family regulator